VSRWEQNHIIIAKKGVAPFHLMNNRLAEVACQRCVCEFVFVDWPCVIAITLSFKKLYFGVGVFK